MRARVRWILLLGAVCMAQTARAQLVSAGAAMSYSGAFGEPTWRSFKFGFRQNLLGNWSYSFDYLNEGHFAGHHRDGYAFEVSYESALLARYNTWLYLGAGPFYYFDTQTSPSDVSRDVHGLAPAFNLSARHRVSANWDVLVSLDATVPNHDFRAHTISIQGAYWLGHDSELARQAVYSRQARDMPTPNSPERAAAIQLLLRADQRSEPTGFFEEPYPVLLARADGTAVPTLPARRTIYSEWAIFGAVSVINVAGNPRSDGGSAEYRLRLQTRHSHQYDLSFAYLYEGDPRLNRRHGVTMQFWPVHSDRHLNVDVAAGLGAYVFVDQPRSAAGRSPNAAVAPVVSTMVSWYPGGRKLFLRAVWDRVVSKNNQDADVWRLGVGSAF
jgi:hypothetical protein